MEEWKVIEATNNTYFVSNYGNVKCNNENVIVKHSQSGYCIVPIKLIFGSRHFNLHQLFAAYFVENKNPKEYTQVNHIDGNKDNNNAENLEWCTPKENQRHKIEILGKDLKGNKNPMYGKGGKSSPVFKGYIIQRDAKTMEVINRYEGSGEASRAIGVRACNIIRVINKKRTYHGCYWEREE